MRVGNRPSVLRIFWSVRRSQQVEGAGQQVRIGSGHVATCQHPETRVTPKMFAWIAREIPALFITERTENDAVGIMRPV